MADVYDFRESAEKLGRSPKTPEPAAPQADDVRYAGLAEFEEIYGLIPPSVFGAVDSNGLGAVHEIKEVTTIRSLEPEPPEMEME